MGAIKITPADRWFSLCIRERADWRCERCGRLTPPDKRMGLHCSHWHGRSAWATRLHPLNAFAHCYGCHSFFEQRPVAFNDWVAERIGQDVADKLTALSKKPAHGVKRLVPVIAAFYRVEHRTMEKRRKAGEMGWMAFSICPDVPDIDLLASRVA